MADTTPTEGECQAALEAIIWEQVRDTDIVNQDDADLAVTGFVVSMACEVRDYIRAHWPLGPEPQPEQNAAPPRTTTNDPRGQVATRLG